MARLVTDGAELGDLAIFSTTVGSVTNTTSNPSSGSRCYRFSSAYATVTVPAATEYYVRSRIRPDSIGVGTIQILSWNSGASPLGDISINSLSNLSVIVTGSSGSTVPVSVSAATYALFETHFKIDSTAGIIEVLIDGTLVFSFTGQTTNGPTTANVIVFGQSGGPYQPFNMDDIGINDTTGVTDNSWCGEGRILMMQPDSVGDVTQLARGGTDTGANWSQVNEIPPDGDTTYVYSSGSGQYDLYGLTSGSSIMNSTDSVARVYVESRSREVSATGEDIRLGLKTGGSEYWSSDIPVTTSYGHYEANTWVVNPNTGLPWTVSDLDNLQAGVKVV